MLVNLLGDPLTRDYKPTTGLGWYGGLTSMQRFPRFQIAFVPDMLIDAKIQFGLYLIKGSILSKGTFDVQADRPEVGEYVQSLLERFKLSGMQEALASIEYGYACSEMMYESRNGLVHYKEAKILHPQDCLPLKSMKTGNLSGAAVKCYSSNDRRNNGRIILGGPKCFWAVHNKNFNQWFGLSRLYNAFLPWLEKWTDGGFRDCRKLFFYKQAFSGGVMYHPPGSTLLQLDASVSQGREIPNRDLAREMVDNLRTGGTVFMPNQPGVDGSQQWKWEPGQITGTPDGLFQYGDQLDIEILEGEGIPREVVQSAGESSGAFGGRSVPMDAFCSILHTAYGSLIADFVKQVVHPLVILNFGFDNSWFQVRPYGLLTENDSIEQEQLEQEAAANGEAPKNGSKPEPKKKGTAMSLPLNRINGAWNRYAINNRLKDSYSVEGGARLDYA